MVSAASRLATALLASGLLAVSADAAASTACTAPKVSVAFPTSPEWQTAASDLTERLRSLEDLDRCARVTVRPSGTGVELEIVTNDGREARRHVETVAELLRTAEALLVLPPEPRPRVAASPLEVPPPDAARARVPAISTHIELGAGASLRAGGGPAYVGGGVAGFAQFALDRWLLAVSGRWDITDAIVNQPTPGDFRMETSVVGVSVGRRLEFASADLDTLVGPNVVLESQDADDVNREVHGAAADFRVALGVRLSGPRSSSVRAFAAADFEASPSRLHSARVIDRALPHLPWWSTGLAVGVLWGAR
ncbi:MAG: hypothetical protein ABI627_16440 [Polyangiaceae bacterium]